MKENKMTFHIEKKLHGSLARAGEITTSHGVIETPAFIPVGTKGTVKAVPPDFVDTLGAQGVLANTFHLTLQPGEDIIEHAGGLHSFMNWGKPIFTDSGGFQVFSLGEALENGGGKISSSPQTIKKRGGSNSKKAVISEEGVNFFSPLDGSEKFMTPELSMEIQQKLGADIIFAFDECTLPSASYEYQKEALYRTNRWAQRSLEFFTKNQGNTAQKLFGIIQGGRHKNLREESARIIGGMDFDGFGIGGSFEKKDIGDAVSWVNAVLPEEKPRHLLGIGEPPDLFEAVQNGCDSFDCVLPTRMGRNGTLLTKKGRINIRNSEYRKDFQPVEEACFCYACKNYSRAYLSHLFRAEEMFGATLASIHNLFFLVSLVAGMRKAILEENFAGFRQSFEKTYLTEATNDRPLYTEGGHWQSMI